MDTRGYDDYRTELKQRGYEAGSINDPDAICWRCGSRVHKQYLREHDNFHYSLSPHTLYRSLMRIMLTLDEVDAIAGDDLFMRHFLFVHYCLGERLADSIHMARAETAKGMGLSRAQMEYILARWEA